LSFQPFSDAGFLDNKREKMMKTTNLFILAFLAAAEGAAGAGIQTGHSLYTCIKRCEADSRDNPEILEPCYKRCNSR
jgi:hypothetical protein